MIKTFDQLDADAQALARYNVMAVEIEAYRASVRAAAATGKDIHSRVNSEHHIKKLAYQLSVIRKWTTNTKHFDRVIESNLMHFREDGTYIRYTTKGGKS